MAAVVQVSTSGRVDSVQVGGAAFAVRLEMLGDGSTAEHVLIHSGEPYGVLVSGNYVVLDDVRVHDGTGDAQIEVTGLRTQLTNIRTNDSFTGPGIRLNGAADTVINGFTSERDQHGLEITGATRCQVRDVNIHQADQEGLVVTSSSRCIIEGLIYNSGRHGISISGSSYNRISGQVIDAGKDTNNTYDGVIVAGDSDHNRTAMTVTYLGAGNQARYGLNISAGTVDGHIEASYLEAGATADFNDAGTGTVLTDDHIT